VDVAEQLTHKVREIFGYGQVKILTPVWGSYIAGMHNTRPAGRIRPPKEL